MRSLLTVLLLSGQIVGVVSAQADSPLTRRTLKGLDGVAVVVEDLDSTVATSGLGREDIQTDVEVNLREAGIPVLTGSAGMSAPGSPQVYVEVSVFQHSHQPGIYAFSVNLEVSQLAHLSRNPQILAVAITWKPKPRLGM